MSARQAFVIRDKHGRVYPARSKRLAPDFYFHEQIYRGDGETVRLFDAKGTTQLSIVRFGEQTADVSNGTLIDGKTGPLVAYKVATPRRARRGCRHAG